MVGAYVNYNRVFAPVPNKQRGLKPTTTTALCFQVPLCKKIPLAEREGEREKKKRKEEVSMYSKKLFGTCPWFASCADWLLTDQGHSVQHTHTILASNQPLCFWKLLQDWDGPIELHTGGKGGR